MIHIPESELNDLRDALEVERATLAEELAGHGRVQSETGDWQGNSSGLEGIEADPTDAADQIEELVINVPLVEDLEHQYKDVKSAIEKMDKGTYGVCEVCGDAIPLERLKANPAARTCIAHA